MAIERRNATSPVLVAVAWAVVSIPLLWGVYNTALNASKLFTSAPGVAAPVSAAK